MLPFLLPRETRGSSCLPGSVSMQMIMFLGHSLLLNMSIAQFENTGANSCDTPVGRICATGVFCSPTALSAFLIASRAMLTCTHALYVHQNVTRPRAWIHSSHDLRCGWPEVLVYWHSLCFFIIPHNHSICLFIDSLCSCVHFRVIVSTGTYC